MGFSCLNTEDNPSVLAYSSTFSYIISTFAFFRNQKRQEDFCHQELWANWRVWGGIYGHIRNECKLFILSNAFFDILLTLLLNESWETMHLHFFQSEQMLFNVLAHIIVIFKIRLYISGEDYISGVPHMRSTGAYNKSCLTLNPE